MIALSTTWNLFEPTLIPIINYRMEWCHLPIVEREFKMRRMQASAKGLFTHHLDQTI